MGKLIQYQFQNEEIGLAKFDEIKMVDLVKVEDPDADGGLTLIFKDEKYLRIKVVNDKLVSELISK